MLYFKEWDKKEYGKIKKEAAKLYPNDIEKYCMYKSQIIEKIYKEIGLKWKKAIRGTLFGWFYFVLAWNWWWLLVWKILNYLAWF